MINPIKSLLLCLSLGIMLVQCDTCKSGKKNAEDEVKIETIKDKELKELVTKLKKGEKVDLNKPNANGEFPLEWTFKETYTEDLVKFLIKHGADVKAKDDEGNTILMKAIMFGAMYKKENVLQVLLDSGADKDAQNNEGKTALMLAAPEMLKGNEVDFLIKAGVDVNKQDQAGETALHMALKRGALDGLIQNLVESPKIDLRIKDKQGNLPFHALTINRLIDLEKRTELLVKKMKSQNVTVPANGWKNKAGKEPWEYLSNLSERISVMSKLQEVTQ